MLYTSNGKLTTITRPAAGGRRSKAEIKAGLAVEPAGTTTEYRKKIEVLQDRIAKSTASDGTKNRKKLKRFKIDADVDIRPNDMVTISHGRIAHTGKVESVQIRIDAALIGSSYYQVELEEV